MSSAPSTSLLLARFFAASFILVSKFSFLNIFKSEVLKKPVVSDILFSISVLFVFRVTLVARLVKSAIYFIWIFIRSSLIARLLLSGILFLVLAFVLSAAVVIKPETQDSFLYDFCNFCIIRAFFKILSISLIFFSGSCFFYSFCVSVKYSLVTDILRSIYHTQFFD